MHRYMFNFTVEKDKTKVEKKSKKKKNKFKVQDDEVSSTTPTSPQKPTTNKTSTNYMANYQPRKTMLIKPIARWYELEVQHVHVFNTL